MNNPIALKPKIGIVMGSQSDYETMRLCEHILEEFQINFETQIVSAHRTPELLFSYAKSAASKGFQIIIAGAGGAAHLPGMMSSLTTLPVLAVPILSKSLSGVDSLLSIVQMPAGVPTATFAIGGAGATNAALFAVAILALNEPSLAEKLKKFREAQQEKVFQSNTELNAQNRRLV